MKKAFVTLSVILLTAVSAFAGGDRTSNRYFASRFSQNWFIDVAGSLHAWQGSDRSALIDPSTIYYKNAAGDFGRYGGSLRIGKFITPAVGMRVALDMNQATNKYGDFIFQAAHFDVMLSLMDWLGGYRDNRVYRMILFGGFGVGANANDWLEVGQNKEYISVLGLMNNFRLGRSFDLHIDLQATAPKWSIEATHATYDPRLVHFDFGAGLGLTWYLGGRRFDVCEACPEVNCPEANCADKDREIKNLLSRIAELENQQPTIVDNGPCDTIVKFINGESAPFSIFFNKNSYQIRDSRDLINLQELVNVAKENGYKFNLRGTCDSATASSEYNKKLAENRCRKVKDELMKLGVAENDIILNAVGGVSELKPAELDRRVLITFSK